MIDHNKPKKLHRLADIRKREGLSLRSVSTRLGVPMSVARDQERDSADLRLSDLYSWQSALNVPLIELLSDADNQYRSMIWERARMVRLMKTVMSILETATDPAVQRMATNLHDDLVRIMPELKDVQAWPRGIGRRGPDDVAKILENPISERSLGAD